MNQVKLDSKEMKEFLLHMITNNRHIQEKGLVPVSTEIIGESGLGKTSIAEQLAEELGIHCEKINLAQIEELGDLVGFPIRQFELVITHKIVVKKEEIGGKVFMKKVKVPLSPEEQQKVWIDENATDDYVNRGFHFTGNKRMSYCPPEWIADKKEGGILLLDDWNRADR